MEFVNILRGSKVHHVPELCICQRIINKTLRLKLSIDKTANLRANICQTEFRKCLKSR